MENLGSRGARGPPEMRVSQESQVPQERKEKLGMRGTQDQTDPLGRGVALEKQDHGGHLA